MSEFRTVVGLPPDAELRPIQHWLAAVPGLGQPLTIHRQVLRDGTLDRRSRLHCRGALITTAELPRYHGRGGDARAYVAACVGQG